MQYINPTQSLNEEERAQYELKRQKREEKIRMKNNRLGIALFQLSWVMIFVSLVFAYWLIGFRPGWKPEPDQVPDLILPTIATIGLILSGWLVYRAHEVVEGASPDENVSQSTTFTRDWLLSLLLGLVFFIIMMTQFFAVPGTGEGPQFGTVYRLMIGYHAVHAIVIGFMMIRVWLLSRDGRYHKENSWPIEGMAKLWYFVVGAWLLFYAVLYLPYLR